MFRDIYYLVFCIPPDMGHEYFGIYTKIGGDNFAETVQQRSPVGIFSISLLSGLHFLNQHTNLLQSEQIHPLPVADIGAVAGFMAGTVLSLSAPLPKNIQAGAGFVETVAGVTILALQPDPLTSKIQAAPIIGAFFTVGGAITLLTSLFRNNNFIPPNQ